MKRLRLAEAWGMAVATILALGSAGLAQEHQFLARNEAGLVLDRLHGARSQALGGAFTALADDATAITANPGGLGQLRSLHITASRDAVRTGGGWQGDFTVGTVALAAPLWGGVGGVSVASLEYGSMELYDEYGARTGTSTPRDVALAASFTSVNPQWFNGGGGWSGMTAEVARGDDGELRPAFCIGSVVPVSFKTSIAWALDHVGPKIHGGILPSQLRAGIAFRDHAAGHPMQVALDAALPFATGRFTLCAGGEGRVAGPLAVRAGYVLRRSETEQRGLDGLTAGFGLRFEQFDLDYAWQPFGDLLALHKVSLTYAAEYLDPAVERRPAAPARRLELMPDNSGGDESGLPEPEQVSPPVAKPAKVARPVPTPAAAVPKPKPATTTRLPAPAPQMPAEITQTEPPPAALVPGSATGSQDDGWIGPPPTATPIMPDVRTTDEQGTETTGDEAAPVAPVPGAGKPAGSMPRLGGTH